jgi:dehydrogenase/reductase SDR family protein 12
MKGTGAIPTLLTGRAASSASVGLRIIGDDVGRTTTKRSHRSHPLGLGGGGKLSQGLLVIAMFGQFAATTQFYLYGRKHFTRTGWEAATKLRGAEPDALTGFDLAGKTYVVTGANQGIGYEIAKYLASRGGKIFMVCRNAGRAEAARLAIVEETRAQAANVRCLICDCGVEADVRSMWHEFAEQSDGPAALNGLVCNAGALFNEKTLTPQGLETTFASHLLFGSYLMTKLALPHLRLADDPRVVMVSSGGMLNTPFPKWEIATSEEGAYDGNLAYAYAKRGQVLLCERWAVEHPEIKFVSSHPGWTATAAVDNAYGDSKSYLEPMRSTWEGAEGIAWLAAVGGQELQSGEFYLDRTPQVKHMAGAFFSEGSFTKNSDTEVDLMCANLDSCANGRPEEARRAAAAAEQAAPAGERLQASTRPIEMKQFMGRWFVIGVIPTYFEQGASNCIEDYVWDDAEQRVDVSFTYTKPNGAPGEILQRAKIANAPTNTEWSLAVKSFIGYVPVPAGYLVLHCAEDYSWTIVGLPDRTNVWIMARTTFMAHETYIEALRIAQGLGFDMKELVKVQHDVSFEDVAAAEQSPLLQAEPEPEPEAPK